MTASGFTRHCVQCVGRCPKAQGGGPAGLGDVSLQLSPFLAVHHGARTCGRKKKESRVSGGVYQLARGIISSYFRYLDGAVREKRSGGILTQRHRVPRQCTTEEGLGGKDRMLWCVMCQGKVFWGERPGYTMACAATTGPRWKVSRALCDKSLR